MATPQTLLFDTANVYAKPFRTQLLKWIGNKQRFAHEIISYFPPHFKVYREPFLGSGAVLGTLAPREAVGSDAFKPLIEIWQTLHDEPETLKSWYAERWHRMKGGDKVAVYSEILNSYNAQPNGADLLFLSRSCYGGVVRFRQDGFMSTPCGPHDPISPESFADRVDTWRTRTSGARFIHRDYKDAMEDAGKGDLIYADPPYSFTQSILYGAQKFSLADLFERIRHAKEKGVFVALSIDGSKKSGDMLCDIRIPDGLFEREVLVNCGRSMLRRFQMDGKTLESEVVHDRLLLTY
ncbi:MAG: DNA methyltransferase [Acidobacteria bacterium]|nr:MAG: DNA methyltransferase [Acidobacteriota bacterium]